MLSLSTAVRTWERAGLRKSIDGLGAIVRSQLGDDVYSGHLFVFVSRRGDRVKALTWSRRGFVVSHVYEGADRPDDVQRDEDGTWRVKLGARVRVRLSLDAPGRRYHVALVDPLPAGFEPLNPALAVTGDVPKDPKGQKDAARGRGWWPWRWSWSRTW